VIFTSFTGFLIAYIPAFRPAAARRHCDRIAMQHPVCQSAPFVISRR
jgi:hypothetical protein